MKFKNEINISSDDTIVFIFYENNRSFINLRLFVNSIEFLQEFIFE